MYQRFKLIKTLYKYLRINMDIFTVLERKGFTKYDGTELGNG